MDERAPMPEDKKRFAPDPAIEAAISAKIEAADARGVNLAAMIAGPTEERNAAYREIGITPEEERYMGEISLYRMVQIAVGQTVIETLEKHGCRVAREDLIPSLTAYFEAVDSGEIEVLGRGTTQPQ